MSRCLRGPVTPGWLRAFHAVVPRTWTHLLAEAAGQPIDPGTPTPVAWREYVTWRTGLPAPEQMTDGAPAEFVPFESGYDPAEPVDRAIIRVAPDAETLRGIDTRRPKVTRQLDVTKVPRSRDLRRAYRAGLWRLPV